MSEPPLRLCYVLSHFHPHASGAERQALAQGRELVRRGHQVRVVTRSVPGLPRDETLQGVAIHRWIETTSIGPLFGLSFVAGVVRALIRLRREFDLVHTHQGLWEAIGTGMAAPFLGGRPTLVQPASSGFYGEAEELMRTKGASVLRRLILRNTAFAVISVDIERQWRELDVPHAKLFRMSSGVDAGRFRPGPCQVDDRLPARPRVLYTGRLHPQKDIGLLLDVWPEVHARSGAHLVLLGAGPDRNRLQARVADLGITSSVQFAGMVSDPADHLRGADMFVLPSVAEGMSNSLLEAMASGLPCVASDIGGNRDLITDGLTGLLVPPHDRAAWSVALLRVLGDPELARTLGAAARRRVEEEFDLRLVVDRYVELYRRLLSGDSRGPHPGAAELRSPTAPLDSPPGGDGRSEVPA